MTAWYRVDKTFDAAIRWAVATWFRRRIARREPHREKWTGTFMQWKRENPDHCMYCAYTKWARETQAVTNLEVEPHVCVEGNSPPHPLPRAKAES